MKKIYVKASDSNAVDQYQKVVNKYEQAVKHNDSSEKENLAQLREELTQRVYDKFSEYCSTSFLDNVKFGFVSYYLKPSILNNPNAVNYAKLQISVCYGTAYNPVSDVYWCIDIDVDNKTAKFKNCKWNIAKYTDSAQLSNIKESISFMEALNFIQDSF